jgi:hypothetical protein
MATPLIPPKEAFMKRNSYLAATAVLVAVGACDAQSTDTDNPSSAKARDNTTCHTITFDDLDLGHGGLVTSIPTPLGFELDVTVTSASMRGVLYSTDTVGGPDPDLEKDAACPDCAGLGNILVIEDSRGFACCGDSPGGGTIALTGFPASGSAFIERYAAVDQESTETAIQLFIDGVRVGGSSGQGNGSVEEVLASSPSITSNAEFRLGGSGGVDNVKVCVGVPGVGRMTGGGNQLTIDGVKVTRGFTIHCDITLSNNVEINWEGNQWHIDKPLTRATCLDDPDVAPAPPRAPFDTFIGEATGRLNGVDGSMLKFTFVDAGEPGGKSDTAEIMIWAPGDDPGIDEPVLSVSGELENGNLQAHYDQPHGSNWNR